LFGELAEGDALPSEAALMAEFAVSRPTLREAFRVLESESLSRLLWQSRLHPDLPQWGRGRSRETTGKTQSRKGI